MSFVLLLWPRLRGRGWLAFDCDRVCARARARHRCSFESSGTQGGCDVFSVRTMEPDVDVLAGSDPRDLASHVVRLDDSFDPLDVFGGGHFVVLLLLWAACLTRNI